MPHSPLPNSHNTLHLLLPKTNHGSLSLQNQTFPLSPLSLFLYSTLLAPQISSRSPNDYHLLPLDSKLLLSHTSPQTDFSKLLTTPFHHLSLSPTQQKNILTFLEKIPENNNTFGSDLRRTLAILELFLYLTPLLLHESSPSLPSPQNNHRITPILNYISENFSEPLCLDQIATHFYLNKHYLCRLFKSSTGFTVIEYITECRISKACELLQQGYSVQRSGELSGFSDNSHFIRTFKQIKHTSPGKYAKSFISNLTPKGDHP